MAYQNYQTALVTGASSGIGLEIARQLAAKNINLVLTSRRLDRLEQAKRDIEATWPVRVEIIVCDLAQPQAAQSLYKRARHEGRPLDTVVCNAGFGAYGPFLDGSPATQEAMLRVNIDSLTRLAWLCARDMREENFGRVLLVSSIGAFQPTPNYALYSATKAYVLYLGMALNQELRATQVRVTTLCPGMTATEFHQVAGQDKSAIMRAVQMRASAVARAGLRGMFRGRGQVTPGWINRINGAIIGLLPRAVATRLAGIAMR